MLLIARFVHQSMTAPFVILDSFSMMIRNVSDVHRDVRFVMMSARLPVSKKELQLLVIRLTALTLAHHALTLNA